MLPRNEFDVCICNVILVNVLNFFKQSTNQYDFLCINIFICFILGKLKMGPGIISMLNKKYEEQDVKFLINIATTQIADKEIEDCISGYCGKIS